MNARGQGLCVLLWVSGLAGVACSAGSDAKPSVGASSEQPVEQSSREKRDADLSPVLPTIPLQVGGHAVTAEVADNNALRSRGLMRRPGLLLDHGMLFVYPDERPRSFWMRDTPLPLSIAYIGEQGQIVHIADMKPFDETPVPSLAPAMYALEMEQGWFSAHYVEIGARINGLPGPSRE